MDGAKSPVSFAGLDEFDEESPGEITKHHEAEQFTGGVRSAHAPKQRGSKENAKGDFVKLSGMSMDTIAEIDAPGKIGGDAVSVIGESFEEATDAADGQAEQDRKDEAIAGVDGNAESSFGDFNAGPTTGQTTDDGFSTEENSRIVEMRPIGMDAFHEGEGLGTDKRAEQAGGDENQAAFGSETNGWEFPAQGNEKLGTGEVTGQFHDFVHGDAEMAKSGINGKGHGRIVMLRLAIARMGDETQQKRTGRGIVLTGAAGRSEN